MYYMNLDVSQHFYGVIATRVGLFSYAHLRDFVLTFLFRSFESYLI